MKRDLLGVVCFRLGRHADAVRCFQQAESVAPHELVAVRAAARAGKASRPLAWKWMRQKLEASPTPYVQFVCLRHSDLKPLREEQPEFWKELRLEYEARR